MIDIRDNRVKFVLWVNSFIVYLLTDELDYSKKRRTNWQWRKETTWLRMPLCIRIVNKIIYIIDYIRRSRIYVYVTNDKYDRYCYVFLHTKSLPNSVSVILHGVVIKTTVWNISYLKGKNLISKSYNRWHESIIISYIF